MSDMAELGILFMLRQMQRAAQIGVAETRVENGVIYAWGWDYEGNMKEGRVVEVAGQPMTVVHVLTPRSKYNSRRIVAWQAIVSPLLQSTAADDLPSGITIDMTVPPNPPAPQQKRLPPSGLHTSPNDRW